MLKKLVRSFHVYRMHDAGATLTLPPQFVFTVNSRRRKVGGQKAEQVQRIETEIRAETRGFGTILRER